MLILTRRCGETIHIGPNITVTVLNMRDRSISLGVDAPKAVEVHRGEIYKRILNGYRLPTENEEARNVAEQARAQEAT